MIFVDLMCSVNFFYYDDDLTQDDRRRSLVLTRGGSGLTNIINKSGRNSGMTKPLSTGMNRKGPRR